MADRPRQPDAPDPREPTPAERVLESSLIDQTGQGQPLSRRSLQRARSVESYLRGEVLPRYMQRARDIERGERDHREALAAAYARLRAACGADVAAFAERWAAHAERWDFSEHNELVAQHNAWYPIERDLPMDPRTGDYVLVSGKPYRRERLDAAWVLARFPSGA